MLEDTSKPLAERLRPTNFDEIFGQNELLSKKAPLRGLLDKGIVPSIIFWGPPGIGKTSLASLIAKHTSRELYTLSAISSGVKEVRETIAKAENKSLFNTGDRPILFIDEIHRFSKSQQDSLLGAVEKGIISLIGATTENPSFEVIPALLSRCQVYTLKALSLDAIKEIINRALREDSWLSKRKIEVIEFEALIRYSGGDARKLLNGLEIIAANTDVGERISNTLVKKVLNENLAQYDKGGEMHYDIVSAFIKSIRGSDPNAAVYWLARMIEGGEPADFIARRLLILASEDIGLANPNALLIANSTFDAVQKIGWPESRIILSQCVIYLANCAKSNSAYMAINQAQAYIKEFGSHSVPLELRNAPSSLMKDLGYGKNYKYAHDFEGNFVDQEFLPVELKSKTFYEPSENLAEKKARERLRLLWPKYKY